MREDQPLPEYRMVLRFAPPIDLREASRTAWTSFTAWADAVPAIKPRKAQNTIILNTATPNTVNLRFMWCSSSLRDANYTHVRQPDSRNRLGDVLKLGFLVGIHRQTVGIHEHGNRLIISRA